MSPPSLGRPLAAGPRAAVSGRLFLPGARAQRSPPPAGAPAPRAAAPASGRDGPAGKRTANPGPGPLQAAPRVVGADA